MGRATQNEARLGNGSYGTLVGNEAKTGYGSGLNDWGHTLAVELKKNSSRLEIGFRLPVTTTCTCQARVAKGMEVQNGWMEVQNVTNMLRGHQLAMHEKYEVAKRCRRWPKWPKVAKSSKQVQNDYPLHATWMLLTCY